MSFLDLFSKQAADYASFRPTYPPELFSHLASLVSQHELCWDVGCGNGQASFDLTKKFRKVWATDASAKQIEHAKKATNLNYKVAPCHESFLKDESVDLVTVAQAAHWFPHDKFYAEVRRVLKPKGVLALWVYERDWKISPAIDEILFRFSNEILKNDWEPEISYVMNHYRNFPFPFEEIEMPAMVLTAEWDLGAILGYLSSWSATQKFQAREGRNPLELIAAELEERWGEPNVKKRLSWSLFFRVGRKA